MWEHTVGTDSVCAWVGGGGGGGQCDVQLLTVSFQTKNIGFVI